MKLAFSTVACPDWTLPRIAERARGWGFQGVEFRTFGTGSTQIACDPALTSAAKIRAMFSKAGVAPVSLATSIRYDDVVSPPVIGHLFDRDLAVKHTKECIELAVQLEAPYVRVFGFEVIGNESRTAAIGRIAGRLSRAADACRNSGVRLLLENAGSFARSADIAEILDLVGGPLVGASYNLAVARAAGESVADGANVLGESLVIAKVKDYARGAPCPLGAGEFHAREDIAALASTGFDGWLVYEHDRMWFKDAPGPEDALNTGARTLYEWTTPRAGAVR